MRDIHKIPGGRGCATLPPKISIRIEINARVKKLILRNTDIYNNKFVFLGLGLLPNEHFHHRQGHFWIPFSVIIRIYTACSRHLSFSTLFWSPFLCAIFFSVRVQMKQLLNWAAQITTRKVMGAQKSRIPTNSIDFLLFICEKLFWFAVFWLFYL